MPIPLLANQDMPARERGDQAQHSGPTGVRVIFRAISLGRRGISTFEIAGLYIPLAIAGGVKSPLGH